MISYVERKQYMENTKKLTGIQKALAIFGIALGSVIALILVILLSLHLFTPVVFHSFFSNAQEEYVTPGIYDGLVPQGYAYDGEHKVYIQCGYMADGKSASRIYITDADNTKNSRYVELYTADGKPYTGHTGGITVNQKFVWIANDGEGDDNCVWVLSLKEVLGAKNGDKITLKTSFQPESRAAFCFVDTNYLWVGEFHDSEKYPTKDTHKFDVAGGKNSALVCAYPLDSDSEYGIEIKEDGDKVIFTPEKLLSITDNVQGFARSDKAGFVLSTSYAVSKSHLIFYKDLTSGDADATLEINGTKVPVYFLDADSKTDDVEMPPMSEEIFFKNDRVYVLFESACMKYIFGNFTRGIHVYSYKYD